MIATLAAIADVLAACALIVVATLFLGVGAFGCLAGAVMSFEPTLRRTGTVFYVIGFPLFLASTCALIEVGR